MEGPFDKVVTFIDGGRLRRGRHRFPDGDGLPADLAYLAGHSLGELLNAEYQATAGGAGADGPDELLAPPARAFRRRRWARRIMFFQLATGYAGVWYGVDPFDQPGVELGKRLTYAAMGRPGYRRPAPSRSRPGTLI